MVAPQVLADTLRHVTQAEYVRFVAHWMTEATDLEVAARLTGDSVVDALVAAATAHTSYHRYGRIPAWTEEPERSRDQLWYPGPDALFAHAIVHSPLLFRLHGALIEADSLESV